MQRMWRMPLANGTRTGATRCPAAWPLWRFSGYDGRRRTANRRSADNERREGSGGRNWRRAAYAIRDIARRRHRHRMAWCTKINRCASRGQYRRGNSAADRYATRPYSSSCRAARFAKHHNARGDVCDCCVGCARKRLGGKGHGLRGDPVNPTARMSGMGLSLAGEQHNSCQHQ